MDDKKLIRRAASVIKTRKTKSGGLLGDVGCALVTDKGNVYVGVCAAVGSNTFCAEQNAIGSMITNKEFKIKKIVAVWKNEKGVMYVIPPCGNCRQLMREINEENLDNAGVLLNKDKIVKLKELLPFHDSWQKVD